MLSPIITLFCSSGLQPASSVFLSHHFSSSLQHHPANSIFLSHHSSSSLQHQPSEQGQFYTPAGRSSNSLDLVPLLQFRRAAARRFRFRRQSRRLLLASSDRSGAGGGEELRDRWPLYIPLALLASLGFQSFASSTAARNSVVPGGVRRVEAALCPWNKLL